MGNKTGTCKECDEKFSVRNPPKQCKVCSNFFHDTCIYKEQLQGYQKKVLVCALCSINRAKDSNDMQIGAPKNFERKVRDLAQLSF